MGIPSEEQGLALGSGFGFALEAGGGLRAVGGVGAGPRAWGKRLGAGPGKWGVRKWEGSPGEWRRNGCCRLWRGG